MTSTAEAKRPPIASLVRSLLVLEELAKAGGTASVAELIAATALERTTVQRILRTLHGAEYVQRTGRGEYSVAPRGYVLGVMLSKGNHLAAVLEPALRRLQHETGESVHAGVIEGSDVVSIAHLPVGRLLTFNFPIGTRIPAYASTLGRAILAHLPSERADQILEQSERESGATIPLADLRRELDLVRERGYAEAHDEIELGLTAVASPVIGPNGEAVAAVNVVVPSSYAERTGVLPRLIQPVLSVGQEISATLGSPDQHECEESAPA